MKTSSPGKATTFQEGDRHCASFIALEVAYTIAVGYIVLRCSSCDASLLASHGFSDQTLRSDSMSLDESEPASTKTCKTSQISLKVEDSVNLPGVCLVSMVTGVPGLVWSCMLMSTETQHRLSACYITCLSYIHVFSA